MLTWPYYSKQEIEAATAVLASGKVNYWTGQECRLFEKEFSKACASRYGVAVANGTVALELALRSLGIGAGDEVVVPSRTFIASASTSINCGAKPVFADVDLQSQTLTAESIEKVLTQKTKAIVVVHLAGWPCDMDPIMDLAKKHNIKVIEDCAQAHGAAYKGRPVGSLGDIAAFSFCQDKIISTGGEGGMLVTNNREVWKSAWSYKDHGKSYDSVYMKVHPIGFRWLHDSIGTNWRMTEVQAAIGRRQLEKLPEWHQIRQQNAGELSLHFQEIPLLRVAAPPSEIDHAYYKYDVFIRPGMLKKGWSRDRILAAINCTDIHCTSGSCSEVYLEAAFAHGGTRPSQRLPVAKELGETCLTLQVHPMLSIQDMRHIAEVGGNILKQATKKTVFQLSLHK